MKKHTSLLIALLLCLSALILNGCGPKTAGTVKEENKNTVTITDSTGRDIKITLPVTRAVISNAYNAELINAIGAIDKVVGVDYHIYQDQEGFKRRFTEDMIIGQAQGELNYEKIIELKPQALIMTSNGTSKEAEEKLKNFGIAVINVDAYYTEQFTKNVELLGQIFGKEQNARELSDYFASRLSYIDKQLKDVPERMVYFEYRSAGRTTVSGDYFFKMLEYAHGNNIFKDAKNSSIDIEAVVQRNPQYIIKVSDTNVYSSYVPPAKEDTEKIRQDIVSRPGWGHIAAVKNGNILLLSHYAHGGASKLVGTMYIAKFMYPEYLPELYPEEVFKTWVTKYQGLEYRPGHTQPAFHLRK